MSDPELSDEEIVKKIAAFEADYKAFEKRRAELTRLYPDRFVVFHRGEIVGEAADLKALYELLTVRDLRKLDPVVHFLRSKPIVMRLVRA